MYRKLTISWPDIISAIAHGLLLVPVLIEAPVGEMPSMWHLLLPQRRRT